MAPKIYVPLICLVLLVQLPACVHHSDVTPSKAHISDELLVDSGSVIKEVLPPSANPRANQSASHENMPQNDYTGTRQTTSQQVLDNSTNVYSVVVYDTPVKEVLFALARDSKFNIDIHPSIQGNITLNAIDQSLASILRRISKQVDISYKIDGNVLMITPDQPVLRTYQVDYVNMSRDTTGFIGAAAEISSTGQSATTGSGGQSTIINTSGNGANNSSRTAVNSESKNHFWETLEKNIRDILTETDKEIVITRLSYPDKNKRQLDDADHSQQQGYKTQALEQEYKEFKTLYAANVIVNREAGIINVRATSKQHERVGEFLQQVLDSVKRQVLIEATIVEVRLGDTYQAGIDWSRLNESMNDSGFQFRQQLGPQTNDISSSPGNFSTTMNALGNPTNAGFIAGYMNTAGRLGNIVASINLLQQFGRTKVLSSPKLMVLNNQTAALKVVDNIVYFTVQSQQSQGSVGGVLSTVTTTANTFPVGVVMTVTPQINDTGQVNVNVRPTISRVIGYKSDPNPNLKIDSLIPEIQVREMESILQINSGNTVVLGGLMQDDISQNKDQVPLLSSIPGLGNLFKGINDANRKTELVIFLKPTVVKNPTLASSELATYQQFMPSAVLNNKEEN